MLKGIEVQLGFVEGYSAIRCADRRMPDSSTVAQGWESADIFAAKPPGGESEELRAPAFTTHRQVDKNVHSPYFAELPGRSR